MIVHSEKLHDHQYSTPNIRMIKSRKNCIGGSRSTHVGEERCIQDFGGERSQLKDLGVDGSILLKWILKKR
jgi:hypothetical protein